MISLEAFNKSVNDVERLLKKMEFLRMRGTKCINKVGVSASFKAASQNDNYIKTYFTGLENYDFDYLLSDQSFFQFEFTPTEHFIDIRYAFFQNPVKYKTYEEFLQEHLNITTVEEIDGVGSLFEEDYRQYLEEQEFISNYCTIRYDSDYKSYKPLIHSVSHLHIGHQNNIRIPINKVITPLKFVLFVIKHVYYHKWRDMVNHESQYLTKLLNKGRREGFNLSADKWAKNEELELFLF